MPVEIWTMPWATAAGSEKGSWTAAVEYVTLICSEKAAPELVVAGPDREVDVGACKEKQLMRHCGKWAVPACPLPSALWRTQEVSLFLGVKVLPGVVLAGPVTERVLWVHGKKSS